MNPAFSVPQLKTFLPVFLHHVNKVTPRPLTVGVHDTNAESASARAEMEG